jgi:hypothetical protein
VTGFGPAVDAALEACVVPGFSRIGLAVRSRLLPEYTADGHPGLDGRTILITGATSGIGYAAAVALARRGAAVHFLARDRGRAERARRGIATASGSTSISYGLADLEDLDAVRVFARQFCATHDRLDVLIHNAGAIHPGFRTDTAGTELTIVGQVVAPFLLTRMLMPALLAAAPSRVIAVSSGGMYTQRLDPARPGPGRRIRARRPGRLGPLGTARSCCGHRYPEGRSPGEGRCTPSGSGAAPPGRGSPLPCRRRWPTGRVAIVARARAAQRTGARGRRLPAVPAGAPTSRPAVAGHAGGDQDDVPLAGQSGRQCHLASAEVTGRQLRERYPVHYLRYAGTPAGGAPAPRRARTAIRSPAAFRQELADIEVAGPETRLECRRGRGPTGARRRGRTRVAPRRRRRRRAGGGADRLRCDHHGQVLNELSRPAPTRRRRARR